MKDPCTGWAGRVFGHKFVTVYDTREHMPEAKFKDARTEHLEAMKTRVSTVKSIHCTRCGKEIDIKQL